MSKYETIEDARTALLNSGVNEWCGDETLQHQMIVDHAVDPHDGVSVEDFVVARMFHHDETPEQALAALFDLDDADHRALGLEPIKYYAIQDLGFDGLGVGYVQYVTQAESPETAPCADM